MFFLMRGGPFFLWHPHMFEEVIVMPREIGAWELTKYSDMVYNALQEEGFSLQNMVTSGNIDGAGKAVFPKIGESKARKRVGGEIQRSSSTLSTVETQCDIYDCYETYKKFDDDIAMAKRESHIVKNQAFALGRAFDTEIWNVMGAATPAKTVTWDYAKPLNSVNEISESLWANKAGNSPLETFVPLTQKAWNSLLDVTAFASADFTNSKTLPNDAQENRVFRGVTWFVGETTMPLRSGSDYRSNAWRKGAVGYAFGSDIDTMAEYVMREAAWDVHSFMDAGAMVIDETALIQINL